MERNHPPAGKRVSSFDQLFRTAVASVVDALLTAAKGKSATALAPPDATDDGSASPANADGSNGDSSAATWMGT